MRMHRATWLFGLASIAIVTSARAARALGPVDVEVGAKGGVGAEYSAGLNPLGFGLGGRAGVVLPTSRITTFDHLYGGVNVMYYFGNGGASSPPQSIHTLMYGGEVGLGFKPLASVTIRPQVGLGNASFSYTLSCALSPGFSVGTTCSSADWARNNLYIEPGVTVLVALGAFFVGGDVNVLVLPGLDPFSIEEEGGGLPFFITLHGQVGVKF